MGRRREQLVVFHVPDRRAVGPLARHERFTMTCWTEGFGFDLLGKSRFVDLLSTSPPHPHVLD